MAKLLLKKPHLILEQDNFDLMYSFIKHYSNLDSNERSDIIDILWAAMEEFYKKTNIQLSTFEENWDDDNFNEFRNTLKILITFYNYVVEIEVKMETDPKSLNTTKGTK